MAKHKIVLESLHIAKDQRTGTINWEGRLELRGQFTANAAEIWYPAPGAFVTASQGEHIALNREITTVENANSVPVQAKLWELEPGGGQGATDTGEASGTLHVAQGSVELPVTISADAKKERQGSVVVTFRAVPVNGTPPFTGTYRIFADSIVVDRDQRTGTINYEGALELRAVFGAGNAEVSFPPTGHRVLRQGDCLTLNLPIVTISDVANVPIRVSLTELEPGGGQGGTDTGSATGYLNVVQGRAQLEVTISGDNWKEKSALVRVNFSATKIE